MGYIRHHAIIVTSCFENYITEAHKNAKQLQMLVTPIVKDRINGYCSFMIAPDGSKEGWTESSLGDDQRREFVEWLDSRREDDGSSLLNWVEVQYGDENRKTAIVAHSDEDTRIMAVRDLAKYKPLDAI